MAYKFLDSVGLAHVFDKIKDKLAGKSDINHTHNYAGSASVGGAADSANKLNTNAGNTGTPVYFENGVPKACTNLQLEVAGNSESATKDADGNVITDTYETKANAITGLSVSGKTITYTKGDGKTGTITTQDTDTTYSAMTASEATTGTSTTARSISAKVLSDKINEVVDANAYTHPSYTAKSSGLYKVTVDAKGHVSATSAVTKSDITGLGIPAQDTVYNLPTAGSSLGGVKTTSTVTSTSGLTACPIIGGVPYYKDTDTQATLSGLGITATAAELNYTDGVTSNIQTQLNGKLSTSGTAAKATADASGNDIVSTYATKTELATALTTDEIDEILA